MTASSSPDVLEEVGRRFNGSLYVGRDYKENPMAYDDAASSVVQRGVMSPTFGPSDERAHTVAICTEQSVSESADSMASGRETCPCDNGARQSDCLTSTADSACGAVSDMCVNGATCGNVTTPLRPDSTLTLPSGGQIPPNGHGREKLSSSDDSAAVSGHHSLAVVCPIDESSVDRRLEVTGLVQEEATSLADAEMDRNGISDALRQSLEHVDCENSGSASQSKLLSDV
jgi:hypothetical protein